MAKSVIRTVLLPFALFAGIATAAPKPKVAPAPKPANASPEEKAAQKQAARSQAQETNQQARAAAQALNASPLNRFIQMTPEERAAALAKLPPARRQQLEQRLANFSKLPPEEQTRRQNQLKKIESLPPEKQDQVRQSLGEYLNIPGPRRMVIINQMNRLNDMTDEQRNTVMAKPQFRARFSEAEIVMMNNLRGIVP